MKRQPKFTGRLTVRFGVETHEQLTIVAHALGIGFADAVNMILLESLPSWLERASKNRERMAAAMNLVESMKVLDAKK